MTPHMNKKSKELIDFEGPFLRYYSMGNPDNIHSIAKEVFLLKQRMTPIRFELFNDGL